VTRRWETVAPREGATDVTGRTWFGAIGGAVAGAAGLFPRDARADDAGDEAPSAYRAEVLSETGFVAAEPGRGETVSGGLLLVLAYLGFAFLLMGYGALLARRAQGTANELTRMERRLQELEDRVAVQREAGARGDGDTVN
jgi:hypothetical protein